MAQKTILIVDDNAPFRQYLRALVQDAGHIAIEAADGQTGIDMMQSQNPDAVLLDLLMEPMGGFELRRQMNGTLADAPTILVTADESSDVLWRAQQLGCSGVIRKPVMPKQLMPILKIGRAHV